jgi:hypothetical protein
VREAEVEHHRLAVGRDDDVRRLQVAVHDAALVHVHHRLRDLQHEAHARLPVAGHERARGSTAGPQFVAEGAAQRVAAGPRRILAVDDREQLLERAALDVLHREPRLPVFVADREDRHDAGMLQPRDRLDFALEALARGRRQQQFGAHDLQRDLALQARLFGDVDDAHAAGPELAQHAELAEALRLDRRRRRRRQHAHAAQAFEPGADALGFGRVRAEVLLQAGFAALLERQHRVGEQALGRVGEVVGLGGIHGAAG